MGHVGRAVRAVGDVPRLRLREDAIDHAPALRLTVARPVVRVDQAEVLRLDGRDRGGGVGRGDLGQAAAGRIAASEVEVDLHGAAGPAGLGLADRLACGGTAVRGLGPRQEAHVDKRLAGVYRQELRREAVVGGDERGRILAHQLTGACQHLVRLLIGRADESLASGNSSVRNAVEIDVVIRRVGSPARQLGRDEPEELVLELIRRGHAGQEHVRVVGLDDVLEHRLVGGLPVQALLDVGLLGRDTGLEDREVCGRRGRELLREVLGEVAREARLARPRRPARDRPAD